MKTFFTWVAVTLALIGAAWAGSSSSSEEEELPPPPPPTTLAPIIATTQAIVDAAAAEAAPVGGSGDADEETDATLRTSCSYVLYRLNAALENDTEAASMINRDEAAAALDDYLRKKRALQNLLSNDVLTEKQPASKTGCVFCKAAVDRIEESCSGSVFFMAQQRHELQEVLCHDMDQVVDNHFA